MNTTTTQLSIGKLAVPTIIESPFFATVRIKKGTSQILDGRTYKTEKGMMAFRSSRPKNAVCIKIIRRLGKGLIECELA